MPEPRAQRITPIPRPDGCDLQVEGYVGDLLTDLITLLRETPALMDDLAAVVDGPVAKPDPFRPEDELPVEQLIADLTDRLSTSIRVYRGPLSDLHGRIGRILTDQGVSVRPRLVRPVGQHDGRWTA